MDLAYPVRPIENISRHRYDNNEAVVQRTPWMAYWGSQLAVNIAGNVDNSVNWTELELFDL